MPAERRHRWRYNSFAVNFRHKRKQENADTKRVGLARALSKLGYCSRSQAWELIREGKVHLNGSVARNPAAPVRLGKDRIDVEGKAIEEIAKIYLVMNKPRGVVTTASDEKGRETVYSLLPDKMRWIAPVGRLDLASEGMLLFTNDSDWAARISDPESHLDKTYHVQIASRPQAHLLEELEGGVETLQGETLKAKKAHVLRTGQKNAWLEIVLDEGKNRQIRRMLDALGVEVLRLIRVAIGPVPLGDLARGKYRALRSEEKLAFDLAMEDKR